MKRWFRIQFTPGRWLGGLVALAFALYGIFMIRELTSQPGGQQAGQQAGMAETTAAGPATVAPELQPTQPEPRSLQQFLPEAQQNVTLGQASAHLEIGTITSNPGYDRNELFARPGQVVSLTFRNLSQVGHHHSWVLTRPGMDQEVGLAAQRTGPEAGYIPVLPNAIVAATRLLEPGDSQTIVFRVPNEPGEYPFICTFPGHWEIMKGTLKVR